MCGVFGISDRNNSVSSLDSELISGLATLQNRGQDAAGIVMSNNPFFIKKNLGMVSQIFHHQKSNISTEPVGIGHVRYTTQGENTLKNTQPFILEEPFGIAMAHNGNVTNFKHLRNKIIQAKRKIQTTNDLELILQLFSISLSENSRKEYTYRDFLSAAEFIQSNVFGAYSVLTILRGYGLLGFTDSNGIRPLFLGKKESIKGVIFAFSSETSSFEQLGFETVRRLIAGEIIFIDNNNQIQTRNGFLKNYKPCIFEDLYFSKSHSKPINSVNHNDSIALRRETIGKILGKKIKMLGLKLDLVIDVPDSGYFYAQGISEELCIPYKKGLTKNDSMRTFISDKNTRKKIVLKKFNVISHLIKNKRIGVVDDSIVRGTISKHIAMLLKSEDAKEIYFISGSPIIRNPCIYGVDMSLKEEMVAYNKKIDEIALYIGVDKIIYPTLGDLKKVYENNRFCHACFSGEYPTKVSKSILLDIAQEKLFRIKENI